MNIDKVMALMPTIGHETQAKIRTALEQLVVSSREEAFCEAADAISGLYSTKPQGLAKRVEALEDGVRGLLPSFVRGRLEECGGIGVGMTHEQRIRALEAGAWMDRRVNENIAQMHGTLLGESYGKLSADQVAVNAARANENTGEDASTRKGDGATARAVGVEVPACDGPSTSSPASPASVPEWVPSASELFKARSSAKPYEDFEAGWEAVRRLIASRAPLHAPQPSVEEMAERLYEEDIKYDIKYGGVGGRFWMVLTSEERAYWLALARAALSALPAPDAPKPAPSPQPAREAQGEPSERISKFLDALEKRFDVDDDDAWMLSRSDLDYLRASLAHRAPSPLKERQRQRSKAISDALGIEDQSTSKQVEAIEALRRAPSPSPALAAIVEAGDAMREAVGDPLYVSKPLRDAAWTYDRARAALTKGGAS